VVSLAEGIRVYRSQMSETPTPGGLEIILLVLQGSLTWIVLAFLTLALSLLVLKMNRGTFSGRTLEVIALGIFIWTFGGAALGMALKVLDSTYSLEPAILWEDWDRVLGALVLLWAVRQAVRSINERDKPTGKYWGI
jgi:hypothetical protein